MRDNRERCQQHHAADANRDRHPRMGVCEDKPIGELIHAHQECLAGIREMPAHRP
jgi:hypothetical protein